MRVQNSLLWPETGLTGSGYDQIITGDVTPIPLVTPSPSFDVVGNSSPGTGTSSTSPYVTVSWLGLSSRAAGGWYPPDNGFAVNSAFAVSTVNSAIQWTTLSGGSPATESLATFFSKVAVSGYLLSDPRAFWDSTNQRFVVTIDDVKTDWTAGKVLIAVSKDSNPNHGWYMQAVDTGYSFGSTPTGSDQPLVSVDGNNIYITTNQFGANGQYYGDYLTTVSDAGLYSGGTSTTQAVLLDQWSYQGAAIATGGSFFIADIGNAVSVFSRTPTATGTPSPIVVSLGTIETGFGNGYVASQPGTAHLLDAGDGRVTSAAYAGGSLYAVFEVQSPSSTTPSVHWVQVNGANPLSPTLVAQGDAVISGAATFNGSIAVDGQGDVIINFTASGGNLRPTDYFTVHHAGDPMTSWTTPVAYQTSKSSYVDPGLDAVGRWGDYSTAIADPNNAAGFWISNEYATGTFTWGTAIAHVVVPSGTVVAVVGTSTAPQDLHA